MRDISLKWASEPSGVRSGDEQEQEQNRKVSVDSGPAAGADGRATNIPEIETGTTGRRRWSCHSGPSLGLLSGQSERQIFHWFLIRRQMSLFVWRICHRTGAGHRSLPRFV